MHDTTDKHDGSANLNRACDPPKCAIEVTSAAELIQADFGRASAVVERDTEAERAETGAARPCNEALCKGNVLEPVRLKLRDVAVEGRRGVVRPRNDGTALATSRRSVL